MTAQFQPEDITDGVSDALKTHLKTVHSLLGTGSTKERTGLHASTIEAAAAMHAAALQALATVEAAEIQAAALDRLAIAIRARVPSRGDSL